MHPITCTPTSCVSAEFSVVEEWLRARRDTWRPRRADLFALTRLRAAAFCDVGSEAVRGEGQGIGFEGGRGSCEGQGKEVGSCEEEWREEETHFLR